jgi:DegV family protein with EDD domain
MYEAAASDGNRAILVLTVMAEKSLTNSVATMTAAQFGKARVEIVDTRSTAGGIGLVATACARLRRSGGSFDEAVALARRLAGKVEILALIDTIDYLKRGGRVTGMKAVLGSLLSIRPIVEVRGEAEMIDRARTREKGLAKLKEHIEQRVAPGTRIHACAMHTNDPDRAREFGEWAQQRFHCLEFWTAEAGPIIGTHAGPGVVGLCWYREEDARA